MKKSLTSVLAVFAALLMTATSCKKDETQIVAVNAGAPTLTSSTTTPDLVLTATNPSTPAATFTYTGANFGYQAAITYTLQLDKKGGDFSNPVTYDGGIAPGKITLTTQQLYNAFIKLGGVSGTLKQVDARVTATLSSTSPAKQVSPVVTLTATPTAAPPACVPNTTGRTWSLIGPAGTDWNTDIPLIYDCNTQTFKAKLALNAAEFKFRANNDWTVNFGTAGATSAITTAALAAGVPLVNNNNNLQITTAGTYNIELTPDPSGTSGSVTIKP